jgi:predicted transcriptional regulator with HTH domain
MTEQNPIQASIDYLIECGWTKEQATNLCKAIHSDESGEHLWSIAPDWIQHCGECKKFVDGFLGTVATGLVQVTKRDDTWLFSLNEQGLKVGKQMFEDKDD